MVAAPAAHAQDNVLFIFDASGSMKQRAGAESRVATAKKAMDAALKEVPEGTRLGLLMFGHRRANDCTDLELVSPIGADDAAAINRRIQSVDAKGETPIAESLRQAARSFAALKGQNNSIVLVTDGIEECKGDPCAAAREIKASGLDIKAHV
jgi:Ca-activated chloride channel homolog